MNQRTDERKTPKCIGCGYTLSGLGDIRVCPECARVFDPSDPSTYTLRRPFMGWHYWATGVGITAAIGIAIMIVDVLVIGAGGGSVWLVAPLLIGMMCGYYVRLKVYALVLVCLLLFTMLVLGLMSASVAGMYCALILAGIALVPLIVGALLGHGVRGILRARGFDLHRPLVLALLAALALGCAAYERLTARPSPIRTVSTTAVVGAPPEVCFDSIMFYEEVKHPAPWILRIGLAKPLRTIGSSRTIGDIKRCEYDKGHITKRVTEVRSPELLAFDVIEQSIGYERDVRLISGSFELSPDGATHTRITLNTTYQPLLGPRWAWALGEDYAIHTLHSHVLEGMRLHAETSNRPTALLPDTSAHP